jgi:hypothetical protein
VDTRAKALLRAVLTDSLFNCWDLEIIFWHVENLPGNDSEVSNNTTTAVK